MAVPSTWFLHINFKLGVYTNFSMTPFFYAFSSATASPPHRPRTQQTIKRTYKLNFNAFIDDLAAVILYLLDKIEVIFTV